MKWIFFLHNPQEFTLCFSGLSTSSTAFQLTKIFSRLLHNVKQSLCCDESTWYEFPDVRWVSWYTFSENEMIFVFIQLYRMLVRCVRCCVFNLCDYLAIISHFCNIKCGKSFKDFSSLCTCADSSRDRKVFLFSHVCVDSMQSKWH